MTDLSRFKTKRHGRKVGTRRSTTKPKRRDHLFAKVSLQGAAAAVKATRTQQAFVWIWLRHLAWRANDKPFAVTNEGLKPYGIDRRTKMRALTTYEKAGLISVVRHKTKAPVVTLRDPI
jgi:hypothetical protein